MNTLTGNTAATKQCIKDQDSKPLSDSSYNNAKCSQISSSLLALYKEKKEEEEENFQLDILSNS